MSKLQHQVLEFHRAFEHPIAESPTIPPENRIRFRLMFLLEELLEGFDAVLDLDQAEGSPRTALEGAREILSFVVEHTSIKVDLPLFADALADLDYVVEGTRLEFGLNGDPIADEVHRANMAKLHDGKIVKREDGKTLKPEGWTPPDIAGVIEKQCRGIRSLMDWEHINHIGLKERARALPEMTPQQKAEQRLDWSYGNLAIDGRAQRASFKRHAMLPLGDFGCGWTEEQFDVWAKDKEWRTP